MAKFTAAVLLVLATAAPAAAQVRFRAETTVAYLDVVVRDAAGRPVTDLEAADFEVLDAYVGRRAIVLFSEGLAVPEVIPRLELIADVAAPSHVSFYTVDASGLRVGGPINPSPRRLTAAELSSVSGPSQISPARIPEMDPSRGPRPLAELTGGLYVADTNDLRRALARVDADRRSYYGMAYRAAGEGPARPRAIEVRVKRPKVLVRARTGLGPGSLGVGSPKNSQSSRATDDPGVS